MPDVPGVEPMALPEGLASLALRKVALPVVVIDRGGSLVFVNAEGCDYLGVTAEEVLGKPVWDVLFDAKDAAGARPSIEGALSDGRPISVRGARSAVSGSRRVTRWHWTPLGWGERRDAVGIGIAEDASQTATCEDRGFATEARSRALLRLMPDLVFRMDAEGRFLEFYASNEQLLYAPPEQIVGHTIRELLPEPVCSQSMACITKTLETTAVQTLEYSLPVAPGHRYFEARHVAVNSSEVLAIVRDITKRKTSEEALRASEKQYRMLMERASDGIVLTDAGGRIVAANRQACELSGWDEASMLSRDVAELLVVNEDVSVAPLFRGLREGGPVRVEARLRHRGGELLDVEMSASRMPDGRVQAILREITERKRAEEALRRSEESFRLLIERSPDLIAVHRGGRVVWANQSCARVFRTDLANMIGRRVLDLVHPDDREVVRQRIVQQQQTGEPVAAMEERFVRDDGTVWYGEVVAIPLEFQGEPSSIVVAHDVTERKRAEEERRSLEQRIQQAQKLQSLGVLAGGIAHDFNNLLMGVLGNASLALLDLPPEAPARDHLQRVEVAARRAADLTRQLLAYSGKGRFLVSPLDLSRVVEEMNHLLATVISKRATVHLDFERNLPPIEADATQMRQVIMNLITNASDSLGDEDGVIVIRTGLVHADASYLASTYVDEQLKAGDYVVLEISDTGCGMDAATVERMFDPFFTTKFTGRGLGLAAVLGIVRGHRGAIKVDSEPGQGTSFRVLFPRAGGAVEQSRAEERGTLGRVGSGTILVVDDEETVRSVARLVLERQGFAVVEAVDGVEAVELFRKQGSQIRLVVLDMTMPKMSGEEAFRALRSLDPDVRILLSSGYNEQEAVNHFADRGLSGFIQKPYTSSELTDRVFQILGET